MLYFWQFLAGLGIGPTLAVFTIIVQNAVPWQKLGVATSNLTFFRQIGGTVGLAIAGYRLRTDLAVGGAASRWVPSSSRPACPNSRLQQFTAQLGTGAFKTWTTCGRGRHGRAHPRRRSGGVPGSSSSPTSAIVTGIHEAFSLAIANTMWLSVVDGHCRGRRADAEGSAAALDPSGREPGAPRRPAGAGVPATD